MLGSSTRSKRKSNVSMRVGMCSARHRNVMTMGSGWMYLAALGIGTS